MLMISLVSPGMMTADNTTRCPLPPRARIHTGMTTADNTTSLAPALDKNAPDYTWQRGVCVCVCVCGGDLV